jgi:hypothetical protein
MEQGRIDGVVWERWIDDWYAQEDSRGACEISMAASVDLLALMSGSPKAKGEQRSRIGVGTVWPYLGRVAKFLGKKFCSTFVVIR